MREILFRGKSEYNGEWIFGSLHIERGETDRNGKTNIDYRILGMRGECDYVIPETVGQFTGLTDTKGKKIFEGDILQYWNRHKEIYDGTCVVKYGEFNCSCCNGVYGWYLEDGDIRYLEDETYLLYEVRGNIYDNPKLLKEGE